MNYIIANCPNTQDFARDIAKWIELGVPFTYDYIENISDAPVAGGWGCARFSMPAPASKLFINPNIEYRYSESVGLWLADGEITEESTFVASVYNYFVTLEGSKP